MTLVSQALREAAARLAQCSDTARLDAELLMAHALGTDRQSLLLERMSDPVPGAFAGLVERRMTREPVAYILGHQSFYGRDFSVSPAVLIPRGDSESVTDAALPQMGDEGRLLDCGVGSGALLLTLLAERPGWGGMGIDRSSEAVAVARDNAVALGLSQRTRIIQADWHEPGWADGFGTFDCIIANPPYVETDAALDPDVRDFEPAGALFAGADGLDDYRVLVPQFRGLLAPAGFAIVEIGATQAASVAEIASEAGFSADLRYDLADRPRALVLRLGVGKAGASN